MTKRDKDLVSREDHLAGLLLLTSGRVPSWYAKKHNPRSNQNEPQRSAQDDDDRQVSFRDNDDVLLPRGKSSSRNQVKIAVLLFLLATFMKVLLFPSYRSTDFLVHRHWKAVTRHLDRRTQWYWDDQAVQTVHTLDYPPGFSLWESFWSNGIFPILQFMRLVDARCLALVDDAKVEASVVDASCVAFMRSTVVISDILWGYTAWVVSNQRLSIYAMLIFHPALFLLDHIHFQYNGFLLAILLLSIHHVRYKRDCLAAALIGLLVSLKHLYLTCCLWYVVVWMKRYATITTTSTSTSNRNLRQLIAIALCGAAPILLSVLATIDFESPEVWIQQVFRRLFPFQRGLVHDYWAGNIWAFYAAANKVLAKVSSVQFLPMDLSPTITIGTTLLLQIPSFIYVNDERIWSSFVLTALASFLGQYHCHEKAILTALMPAIVDGACHSGNDLCFHAAALVSLYPLFYESNELALKVSSTVCFLASYQWWHFHSRPNTDTLNHRRRIIVHQAIMLLMLSVAVLQLEVFPTIGRYEFLKLAVVSLSCGLVFLSEYVRRLCTLPLRKRSYRGYQ